MKKNTNTKNFLSRKSLLFGLFVLVIVTTSFYFVFFRKENSAVKWKESVVKEDNNASKSISSPYYSFLDGHPVSSTEEEYPQVVGTMIDNIPDVPTQAGINDAKIVYEAMAEGGVTRYLAIFDASQEVSQVGPIRSARRYFLDWIQEYGDAMYMHVGGSPEALTFLKQSDIFDVNEFGWGTYFWRSEERTPPHNVLTSSSRWQTILEKTKDDHPIEKWEGWKFGDLTGSASRTESVLIPYFSNYKILWKYDASTGKYERFVNERADVDSNKVQLFAHNIIIQSTATKVLDEVGRRKIETVGSGEALVFRNGKIILGKWSKENMRSRTKFLGNDGKEILLAPGKTFVQILPDENFSQIKY